MSRARTLNGANQFEVDELNIVGDGLAINDNFGLQNQFLGKDVNNELVYKDLDIQALLTAGFAITISEVDGVNTIAVSKSVIEDTQFISLSATSLTGALLGNATTASTLETSRLIGDVSFNGSTNINPNRLGPDAKKFFYDSGSTHYYINSNLIPFGAGHEIGDSGSNKFTNIYSINFLGNATTSTTATTALSCSGNSATATKLIAPRLIGGINFDGTADINPTILGDVSNKLYLSGTHLFSTTDIKPYGSGHNLGDSGSNKWNEIHSSNSYSTTFTGALSGNASTSTSTGRLTTPINIGGVAFDGSNSIELPGVTLQGNQDTTGNATTSTSTGRLTTAVNIGGVAFDGSNSIDLPGVTTQGNQDTTGNAETSTTASKLNSAFTANIDGGTHNISNLNLLTTTAVNTGNLGNSGNDINLSGILVPVSGGENIGKTGSRFTHIYSTDFTGTNFNGLASTATVSYNLSGAFTSDIDAKLHSIIPESTNVAHNGDLGSATKRWNNIYAGNISATSISHTADMSMNNHKITEIKQLKLNPKVGEVFNLGIDLEGGALTNFKSISFLAGVTTFDLADTILQLHQIGLHTASTEVDIKILDNLKVSAGKYIKVNSIEATSGGVVDLGVKIKTDTIEEHTGGGGLTITPITSFSNGLITSNITSSTADITIDSLKNLKATTFYIDAIHRLAGSGYITINNEMKISHTIPISATIDLGSSVAPFRTITGKDIDIQQDLRTNTIGEYSTGQKTSIINGLKTNTIGEYTLNNKTSIINGLKTNTIDPYTGTDITFTNNLVGLKTSGTAHLKNISLSETSGANTDYGLLEYSHSKQYIDSTQEGATSANLLFREFDGEVETTYMKLYINGNASQKTTKLLTKKQHNLGVQDTYSGPRTDGTQYIAYRTACGVQAGTDKNDETFSQVSGRLDSSTDDPIELIRIDNNLCKTTISGGYGVPLIEFNHHLKTTTFKDTAGNLIMTIRHDKSKLSNTLPDVAGRHFSPLNIAINDTSTTPHSGSAGGIPYDPLNSGNANEVIGDVYADANGFFRFAV